MTRAFILAFALIVGFATVPAAAGEAEERDPSIVLVDRGRLDTSLDTYSETRVLSAWASQQRQRPAAVSALYVSLAALQAADIYTTQSALKRGAHEANPVMGPVAGNTAAMLAMKAVSTATTIYFTERVWKQNRAAAIAIMVAANAATVAVAAHNHRTARDR